MLVGVRVPETVEACSRIGLDVATWLHEGLVDRLLVGGGYIPFTAPVEELVALGHANDVPVYPCINCGAPSGGPDEALRGAASNIYWSGADGIYLWNYQYRDVPMLGYGQPGDPVYELLKDLGTASGLRYLDKTFSVENDRVVGPYAVASHSTQLPVALGDQALAAVRSIRLRVGDDVATAHQAGMVAGVSLELTPTGSALSDIIAVQLNGARLRPQVETPGPTQGPEDPHSYHYDVPPAALIQGDNAVAVWIEGRTDRSGPSVTLDEIRVKVNYARE